MREFKHFFNELNQKYLKQTVGPEAGSQFNDIFGNKKRILIPLESTAEKEFKSNLENLGYTVDLKTGYATKGNKIQRIGILLNNILRQTTDSKIAKYLNWWEKNRDRIGRDESHNGLSIIISRAPVDIVRMSDHEDWESCTQPGKDYFQCAIQEAKTGGAVAYIIKNEDASKIDLDAPEIFADPDRGITGIKPLSRIKLRRFTNGNLNILVPELSEYGQKFSGFKDTVKNWAKSAQKDIVDFDNPPLLKNFQLKGGSQQDDGTDDLWVDFFNTDPSGRSLESADIEDEKRLKYISNDHLSEIVNNLIQKSKLEKYEIEYELIPGKENLVTMNTVVTVIFSLSSKDFIRIPDANTLEKELNKIGIIGSINGIHNMNNYLTFSVQDRQVLKSINQLKNLLANIKTLDQNYFNNEKRIEFLMQTLGYLKNPNQPQRLQLPFNTSKNMSPMVGMSPSKKMESRCVNEWKNKLLKSRS